MAKKEVARAQSAASQAPKAGPDVALLMGTSPDGQGTQILRAREGKLELGTVHPLREGAPIQGEVVQLKPRADAPLVCDVEVLVKVASAPPASDVAGAGVVPHKGPARVASDAYRTNWDAIWNKGNGEPELLN